MEGGLVGVMVGVVEDLGVATVVVVVAVAAVEEEVVVEAVEGVKGG